MHLQIAAKVAELNEGGQPVLAAASISPEFSRNSGGMKSRFSLAYTSCFVSSGDPRVGFDRGFAGDLGQLVFVEGVAHLQRAAAQGHVVLLRAGEIDQRCAEILRLEQAHVHLQPVDQAEAELIFALRQHLLDGPVAQNMRARAPQFLRHLWLRRRLAA